jgi:rhodanese-related sulfurtransferase
MNPKQNNMKKGNSIFSKTIISILFITAIVFSGCKNSENETVTYEMFDKLIEYIEENGDFINSEQAPSITGAEELMSKMEKNIHIIDIRPAEQYAEKHISGAVNVPFSEVIDYFETSIEPSSFETIYFISSDGQASAFANCLVSLLGHKNTKSIRYGMSAWDEESAKQGWLLYISSEQIDKLTTEEVAKNTAGKYPEIWSESNNAYDVLRNRAKELLSHQFNTYTVTNTDVIKNPSAYYIINYWGPDLYAKGHLPGAIQYTPKKSLKRSAALNTLPIDKPIVVYCYTGQHSAVITAYLRILGYDAYSLKYGTNGFMHRMLVDDIGHAFTEKNIMNYPVVGSSNNSGETQTIETKKVIPQGGC